MTKYIFCIFTSLFSLVSYAMNTPYSFRHITMNNGLSHNQVNHIYSDNDGFMWFSTASGLCRFDGYSMKTFLHTADSTSLRYNYVEWVFDIADNKMFLRARNTYFFFDKASEQFSSAYPLFEMIGIVDYPSCASVDHNQNIWIAEGNLCYVYSTKSNKIICKAKSFHENSPVTTFCPHGDKMYVVYIDGTVAVVDIDDDDSFTSITIGTPVSGAKHTLYIDSDEDWWIRSHSCNGVWYYNNQANQWHHCTGANNSFFKISDFSVTGVCEDAANKIWVASDHGGISVIDKETRETTNLTYQKNNNRSLISNSINCLFCDENGNMWIADKRAGVSVYNECVFKFDYDPLDIDDIEKNFVSQINTIEEDLQGNMWYGSNGHGLLFVNTHDNTRKLYRNTSSLNSLSSDVVVDLLADSHGNLWIGTFLGGLCRFDGEKFISYHGKSTIATAAAADHIWSVAEGPDGVIWIGSLGSGVASYDPNSDTWRQFTDESGKPGADYISKIFAAKDGKVYIATASGVSVYNTKSGKYANILNDDGSVFEENVNDVYVDSRGLLWVASREGLHVYDARNGYRLKTFNKLNGMPNDIINGIVEDVDKNMWVTTIRGITNIIVNPNPRNDEYNFSLYNYNEYDGVLNGSLNVRSIKRTSYGDILIGGDPGVNRFRPEDIKYNKSISKVTFTSASILGNAVKIGDDANGNVALEKALPYADKLVLDYEENMFSISFSTLSYILPEKISFSYMLEGFNEKWITTDGHKATYTNLSPGTYRLQVKAENCDGFECETPSSLTIIVLPPWWMTSYAYVCYFFLMLALIFFFRQHVTRRERERFKLRQIEAEIQKKHEIDELKLRFFTNISHELRTPLSLIISPLYNIMATTNDENLRAKLELIHRNAQKLLSMVNQLLDFRKTDVNVMQVNMSDGDLVSFTRQCSDSFSQLAERHVEFVFSKAIDAIYTRFDRDKMAKVISNLLSNAFKFTPDNGMIKIWVGMSDDRQQAVIKVSDTGVGIDDKYKPHIFERFYQVPQKDSSYTGSGIGLHLVKEFVTMHNGSVSVSDNEQQGTVFTVTIPILPVEQTDDEHEEIEISQTDKPRGMIVDDNADFRTLLYDSLSDSYEVIPAKDGAEAFQMIQHTMPDLVITDVMMPVMDGNELCQKVKNDIRYSHIPVIMLTAKSAEEHKIEGLISGADEYISKPFNPQILRLRVEKLIESGKKRHEAFSRQIEPSPSEITITPLDEKLIQKAIKYVEDNISDADLSVEEMSRFLGMSRVHLYKKLLSITGRSPIEFIRVIRLKRAAQLLHDKQQNIADVAYSVGFNNPKYFSKYFKEEFGMLPSVYQSNAEMTGAPLNFFKSNREE